MAGFPAHVDSSLLTIAPRANVSGLSVRDYASGRYVRVERHMQPDEAVLFVGDAISFVSSHHFPACMHRPDALEMVRAAPSTRLSTPFFLYADKEATLDATLAARDLPGTMRPSAPRLSVRDFLQNRGNVREEWSWKASRYYVGRVICRDSDEFPGLEVEGDMEYDDDDW